MILASNQTVISGLLPGDHPENAAVDIYVTDQVDPSGFGQGEYYLGKVTPTVSGVFRFICVRCPPHGNMSAPPPQMPAVQL